MHFPAWIFKVLFFVALLLFQRLSTRGGRKSGPSGRSSRTRVPTSFEPMGGDAAITSKPLTPK
jgi:hypothetical protein